MKNSRVLSSFDCGMLTVIAQGRNSDDERIKDVVKLALSYLKGNARKIGKQIVLRTTDDETAKHFIKWADELIVKAAQPIFTPANSGTSPDMRSIECDCSGKDDYCRR